MISKTVDVVYIQDHHCWMHVDRRMTMPYSCSFSRPITSTTVVYRDVGIAFFMQRISQFIRRATSYNNYIERCPVYTKHTLVWQLHALCQEPRAFKFQSTPYDACTKCNCQSDATFKHFIRLFFYRFLTKIDTDVKNPKRKNEFVRGPPCPLFCPPF